MAMDPGPRRLTHSTGDWLAIAGPTSLVLLPPEMPTLAGLHQRLWEAVLAQSSAQELKQLLAALGAANLPSQAVFSWDSEKIDVLIRGNITILDADTHVAVASGNADSWVTTQLSGQRYLLNLGNSSQHLPLLAGGVRVGELMISSNFTPTRIEPTQVLGAMTPYAPGQSPIEMPPGENSRPDDLSELFQLAWQANDDLGNGWHVAAREDVSTEVRQLVLELADQDPIMIDEDILVGRAPQNQPDITARLVKVLSPNHDISRTHLLIQPHEQGALVTDLASTNGTKLTNSQGQQVKLTPNEPTLVSAGDQLDIGDGQILRFC